MVDIKDVYRKILGTVRRYGYYIDDEIRSEVGLSIVIAMQTWDEKREVAFETYATTIALNAISNMPPPLLLLDDWGFLHRKVGRDNAQRFLLTIEEPFQSIGFAVWIEDKLLKDVAKTYGYSVAGIRSILDLLADQLREGLSDEP